MKNWSDLRKGLIRHYVKMLLATGKNRLSHLLLVVLSASLLLLLVSPNVWIRINSEAGSITFGKNGADVSGQIVKATWSDVPSFLEKCSEFDGSEQALTSMSFEILKPLFSSPMPDYRKIADILQLYNASYSIGNNDMKATCYPWTIPVVPSHPKIAMVMIATKADDSAWQLSVADKEQYAKRHGYDLHIFNESVQGRHPSWTKLPAALSLMDKYDWIFGIDIDTVILNHHVKLEGFIDPFVDAVFTVQADTQTLNAGVYLWKACTWMKMLLVDAWTLTNLKESELYWEQPALISQMGNYMLRNHVKLIPQDVLNQFPSLSTTAVTAENVFIVHLAGRGDKQDQIKNYFKQRIGVVGQTKK